MTILSVRNLTKKYSASFTAVKNISFSIEKGETLGLLGPNGAGKTTTIHMLLSTLTPTSGSISYFGKNFFTHRSDILQRVGFGTTYSRMPGSLTVEQNLDIYGRLYGLSTLDRTKKIKKLLKMLNVWKLREREAGDLSAGEMTRVVLVKAFLADPEIVLLDEPTASLDVDVAQEIRDFICQKRDEGVSFLFTSHNMHEMTHVCDRIIVMQHGEIIADSTPEKLSKTVSKSFLELMMNASDLKSSIEFAKTKQIPYTSDQVSVTFEIDEHAVAQTLQELAKQKISYTGITIQKPSLEDYFISLMQEKRA